MKMNVENIELYVKNLQSNLKQSREFNVFHTNSMNEITEILMPIWKKAFASNLSISESVAKEFSVHPNDEFHQENLANPVEIAKAIQKTLYYIPLQRSEVKKIVAPRKKILVKKEVNNESFVKLLANN